MRPVLIQSEVMDVCVTLDTVEMELNALTSMNVTIAHVMTMQPVVILKAVLHAPATMVIEEMEHIALVRERFLIVFQKTLDTIL